MSDPIDDLLVTLDTRGLDKYPSEPAEHARQEAAAVRALCARVAELEAALRPLAHALSGWSHAVASTCDIGRMNYDTSITAADVYRARAALAAKASAQPGSQQQEVRPGATTEPSALPWRVDHSDDGTFVVSADGIRVAWAVGELEPGLRIANAARIVAAVNGQRAGQCAPTCGTTRSSGAAVHVVGCRAGESRPGAGLWCPQCGPGPRVDEDGCCASCGCTVSEVVHITSVIASVIAAALLLDRACVPSAATNELAAAFHEAYERLAPAVGYATRAESRKPWADVPEQNKKLMRLVVAEVVEPRIAAERKRADEAEATLAAVKEYAASAEQSADARGRELEAARAVLLADGKPYSGETLAEIARWKMSEVAADTREWCAALVDRYVSGGERATLARRIREGGSDV